MCWNLVPVLSAIHSSTIWLTLPLPGVATEMRPGCALAAAITSATVLKGAPAFAASTIGASLTSAIGAKSRATSYGMSLNNAGLIATSPTVAMVSV